MRPVSRLDPHISSEQKYLRAAHIPGNLCYVKVRGEVGNLPSASDRRWGMRLFSQAIIVTFVGLAGCSGDEGRTTASPTRASSDTPTSSLTPAAARLGDDATTAAPSAPATNDSIPEVAPTASDHASGIALRLHVQNGSYDEDPVGITVTIDGSAVVDGTFAASQHEWATFDLVLAPGEHRIEAQSDTGAAMTSVLVMPDEGQRWAFLGYEYSEERSNPKVSEVPLGRRFLFRIDDEAMYID
jgi:hypothetical protein